MWLASDTDEIQIAQEKYQRLTRQGVRCRLLNQAEMYAIAPQLKSGLLGALEVLDDGILYAPCAAEWFLEQFPDLIQVRNEKVQALDEYRVQFADGSWQEADYIVVANGIAEESGALAAESTETFSDRKGGTTER